MYLRDSLTAFSTASAPLLARIVFFLNVPGVISFSSLRQPHVRLVGGDERAGMDVLRRLILNRLHHGRRRVSDGQHPDAAGEIDERVAVHVEDEPAVGALDDDVGRAAETGRRRGGASRDQIARAWTGNLSVQSDVTHGVRP